MKFKKGDMVVVVGNKSGDAPVGKTGEVKREGDCRGIFIVYFEGGPGWEDRTYGGYGWNVKEEDLELLDEHTPYDIDE